MYKKYKIISIAVSFALLIQLNAFGLSNEISEEPSDTIPLTNSSFSDDYGDTFDSAFILQEGIEINGAIDKESDIDVFKFIPVNDGLFDFYFTNSTDANIKITDSYGTVLDYTEPSDDYTRGYNVSLSKDRVYYVIASQEAYTGGYSLIVIPNNDDYSNFIEEATIIEIGSNIAGILHNLQDIDYICFIPKESGTYRINFKYGFYNAAILDINEKPLSLYNNNYLNLSSNTKYYIKFWNGYQEGHPLFEFSIKLLKEDYGDTFSDSNEIEQDIHGSIYQYGDYDVFSFKATDKSFRIDSDELLSENVTLYNKSHELIDKTSSSDLNPSTYDSILQKPVHYVNSNIIYENLSVGDTYYLKVGGNINPVEYNVSLYPFSDDYGNTYESAQIIESNTPINGKFDYSVDSYKDKDVFIFIPKISGTYSLDTSLSIKSFVRFSKPLENYIKLEKLDYDSKAVLLSPNITESYCLNFDLVKDEKYFLTLLYVNIGAYNFTVNGPLPTPTPTLTPAPTHPSGVEIGDVNGDGSINSIDFAKLRMYLLGMIEIFPNTSVHYASDINRDGSVNSLDFAMLRKYLLGTIKTL